MKRSTSSSRISSGRSSSGSSSPSRVSSGSSFSGGSSMGRTSFGGGRGGNTRISPFGILVLFIIFVVLVVGYVALTMHWWISLLLLIASVAGILINALIGKPELTPEDKLREATIKQFQVPNSKEAFYEFTLLAIAKIRPVSKAASMFKQEEKRQLWVNRIWTEK